MPEVWLNAVGPDRTVEDEKHLGENPQRVDFVMLANGKKCVIEIDGPSGHYADYDEITHTYSVNESLYAKNLKIERSLRRQGWEIHRFANVEVNGVGNDEFTALVGYLPGSRANAWFPVPTVSAESVKAAMARLGGLPGRARPPARQETQKPASMSADSLSYFHSVYFKLGLGLLTF